MIYNNNNILDLLFIKFLILVYIKKIKLFNLLKKN